MSRGGVRESVRSGRQAVAIGIHALPYSRDLGMTEAEGAARAILGALAEAGIDPARVDGLIRYGWDTTTEIDLVRLLGLRDLRVFGSVDFGGGAGAPTVAHAAMAIERGVADTVVTWRSRKRASGGRPWVAYVEAPGERQFHWPVGLVRPVDGMAMRTRWWMREYGWTREDLAEVAITQRRHAQANPAAVMQKDLDLATYLDARMISDPLCLFDNCLETDGALALVLTAREIAEDMKSDFPPVYVSGYAMGSGPEVYMMANLYGDLRHTPAVGIGPELWQRTGLGPADIDVVQFYDAFTPLVLKSFEEYGFCGDGEGAAYARSPSVVPYNTSGGCLSEAYVHGFNLILEAVRQVRGTSTAQVGWGRARHSLVTSGSVVPTGAAVFSSEPW